MNVFDKDGALSREYLLSRGTCCDNGCKNCPYKGLEMEKQPNSKCPSCGKEFHCVCKNGGYPFNCWCMDYANANLPKDLPEEECICEDCMKKYSNKVQAEYERAKKYG